MRQFTRSATICITGTLFLAGAGIAQFAPSPTPPVTFPTGHAPSFVVVSDFNGDSRPDLAVANKLDNTVTILLGLSSGNFAASGSSSVGANPSSIAVSDFDHDGNQDIAVANEGDGTVTVLLGNGSGGIRSTLGPFAVAQDPASIALGDFNGDSFADLAVVNRGSGSVTILLNDQKGNFNEAPYSPVAVGHSPSSIVVADFNNDHYPDLAVTNELDNTVTVLLANSAGGFNVFPGSPYSTGANPDFIVSADFNGDSIPDLAIANLSANNITILLGNGAGGFSPSSGSPASAGLGPVFLAAADFNGDGLQDLATADSGRNTVTVLLGNGSGGFKPAAGSPFTVGTKPYPDAVGVGDFNGDGKLDLAVTDLGDADVSILLNGFAITPVMVSAASYSSSAPVAPSSIVSIFGAFPIFAPATPESENPPSPCLAGTGVTITDASGVVIALDLFYAGPAQINAYLPQNVATGSATFAVTSYTDSRCQIPPSGGPQKGTVTVAAVAPSLFTANDTGKGVAAAEFASSILNPAPQYTFNYPCLAPANPCTPAPIDVSAGSSVLILYGTGIRNRSGLSAVTVSINNQTLTPFYAGPAPLSTGEDQVNVPLPTSLMGLGTVFATVFVAGTPSNPVTLCFTNAGNSPAACGP